MNKEKLKYLNSAGLDEIRFNISARNYDLRRVEDAIGTIKMVTIEIPSIPEDYTIVKRSLIKMQKMGIDYLNIHQLTANVYNYRNYRNRDYKFLHNTANPVFESEIAALHIIKYAIEKGINISINYCTPSYKERFQGTGRRKRAALLVKENLEEFTSSGYLRSLSITGSKKNIKMVMQNLRSNKTKKCFWSLNNKKTRLFLKSAIIYLIKHNCDNILLEYFGIQLRDKKQVSDKGRQISLGPNKSLFVKKDLLFKQKGLSPILLELITKIFYNKIAPNTIRQHFYKKYKLNRKTDIAKMLEEERILQKIEGFEQIEEGFPDVK